MARYALLLGSTDLDKRSGNPAFGRQIYERYTAWLKSIRERGHKVEPHKLRDQSGVRLSVRGGQVVEGPFMETKEAVGGLILLEAETLAEAVEIARGCPALDLQNGTVEVRIVEEVRGPGSP
ncbi:MAG TPA: YciI family protein [Polyangiaceae bacterium]|nr:YciI family protein [Polyangiaceae bacterium]